MTAEDRMPHRIMVTAVPVGWQVRCSCGMIANLLTEEGALAQAQTHQENVEGESDG